MDRNPGPALRPQATLDEELESILNSQNRARASSSTGKTQQHARASGSPAAERPPRPVKPSEWVKDPGSYSAQGPSRLQHAKVSPKFLHSNSTSHVWAFGALAELVDNAQDSDCGAQNLHINLQDAGGQPMLVVQDDGRGMSKSLLHDMMSFGKSNKAATEATGDIGQFGNGFKSASMRLADDVLVLTKTAHSAAVGMLSQTFLRATAADDVYVPLIEWETSSSECAPPAGSDQETVARFEENIAPILKYSPLKSKSVIEQVVRDMPETGTRIVMFNMSKPLEFRQEGTDLHLLRKNVEDELGKKNPYELSLRSTKEKTLFQISRVGQPRSVVFKLDYSLREYLSMLYLKPRVKLHLQDALVKPQSADRAHCSHHRKEFEPFVSEKTELKFDLVMGFPTKELLPAKDRFSGFLIYSNGRLVKSWVKYGFMTWQTGMAHDARGVVNTHNLQPTHNKQEFLQNKEWNLFESTIDHYANHFWSGQNSRKGGTKRVRAEDSAPPLPKKRSKGDAACAPEPIRKSKPPELTEDDWPVGTVVWIKNQNYPWWPGKVMQDPNKKSPWYKQWFVPKRGRKEARIFVESFNVNTHGDWVTPSEILLFNLTPQDDPNDTKKWIEDEAKMSWHRRAVTMAQEEYYNKGPVSLPVHVLSEDEDEDHPAPPLPAPDNAMDDEEASALPHAGARSLAQQLQVQGGGLVAQEGRGCAQPSRQSSRLRTGAPPRQARRGGAQPSTGAGPSTSAQPSSRTVADEDMEEGEVGDEGVWGGQAPGDVDARLLAFVKRCAGEPDPRGARSPADSAPVQSEEALERHFPSTVEYCRKTFAAAFANEEWKRVSESRQKEKMIKMEREVEELKQRNANLQKELSQAASGHRWPPQAGAPGGRGMHEVSVDVHMGQGRASPRHDRGPENYDAKPQFGILNYNADEL